MALTRPSFTQLTTTITSFTDPITVLHQGASSPDVDVGFLFNRANGLVSNVALYWSEATQSFVTAYTGATGVTNANVTPTSYANVRTGNITANGFFWSNGAVFSSGSTFTGGYVPNQSTFGANLVANSGTTSTSTTTGALVVSGGMGVDGNIYVGGNVYMSSANVGATTYSPRLGWTDNYFYRHQLYNGAYYQGNFLSINSGILYIEGGALLAVRGSVLNDAGDKKVLINSVSQLSVANTLASTSTTTGALLVAGGAGVAGALYIANTGDISANIGAYYQYANANLGTATTNITTLFSNAAAQATTLNTHDANIGVLYLGNVSTQANLGAYQTYANTTNNATQANIGAFYIYANANLGTATTNITTLLSNAGTQQTQINNLVTNANANVAAYLPTYSGAVGGTIVSTNFSTGNAVITGGSINATTVGATTKSSGGFTTLTATGATTLTSGTESLSTATGALVVTGGVGVSGNLWIGGNLYVANVVATTTNQLVVNDPLVYFQNPAPAPYNFDIGFYSDFVGGPVNAYGHSGLVRQQSANTWVFFSNVKSEPTATSINWADAGIIYDALKTGDHIIANTTVSTSTTTGALQVSGGAGIAGALYITNTGDVSANIGSLLANAGAQGSSINTINANIGVLYLGNISTQSNLGAYQTYANGVMANFGPNVGTLYLGNISTQANLGAYQTYANGVMANFGPNVGTLYLGNISTQANLGAYQTYANTTNNTTQANIGTIVSTTIPVIQANLGAFETYANTKIGTNTNSNLVVVATTTSTSTTTGALVVAGGVGIAGNLNIGGSTQAAAITSSGTIIASTINAGTIGNASAVFSGASATLTGTLIATTVNAGTIGNSGATLTGTVGTAAQNSITTMTGLTGFGTASVVTTAAGHLTVTGNLTVNGTQNIINNTTYETTEYVVTQNATFGNISNSLYAGSLNTANAVITGGYVNGLANLTVTTAQATNFSSGNIYATSATAGTWGTANAALYTSTTALTTNQTFYPQFANIATTGNTITGVSANWIFNPSTGNMILAGTTTSTSTTTGALVIAGGVGIAGQVTAGNIVTTSGVYWANGAAYSSGSAAFTGGYVVNQSTFGANLVANSATTSTSNVTGAVVVAGAGGLGVGGNVYVGNRVGYVWGGNSVSSAYTYFNSATNSIDTVFG